MKPRQHNGSQLRWAIACTAYFAFILGVIVVADLGKLPTELLDKIPYYDTIGHFLLYGIASYLVHRATGKRMVAIALPSLLSLALPLGPLLFSLFALIEEIGQMFFPNRTASLSDGIASFIGIVLFYSLGEWGDRQHRKPM